MKLAVIGAGSTYSPEIVDGLIRTHQSFPVTEVAFMDIDEKRVQVVGGFCQRMVEHQGSRFKIEITTSLRQALAGADFVITQIRVGGQEGRHWDESLGISHGIVGQETTGVGGFAKAMRTIPQILEICRVMEEVAPEAWLINFTNPSGIVTEAITRFSQVKAVGLCNVPINMKMDIARLLGVDPQEVFLDYVGLNHLAWVRRVYHRGRDVTGQVLSKTLQEPANISKTKVPQEFLRALGMIPSPYLKYFYNTPAIIKEQAEAAETRAQQVMKVEEQLLKIYADPREHAKPELLSKRGGAYYSHAAVEIMESIYRDRNQVLIVNLPNQGAIFGLEASDVVEIPAVVGSKPPRPLTIGRLEPEILGLISQVKAYERLTVEAAVEKSKTKALLALASNPLVNGVEQAAALVEAINSHYQLDLKD